MSEKFEATLHEIATDGLPDMGKLIGRVAFIFDGCIVSGWPLDPSDPDVRENMSYAVDVDSLKETLWEGNHDVAHGRFFPGVTHWIELPVAAWRSAK